ncbi:MAG: hypothetical protein COW88_01955 [Candidatus Lloydbacteria bacterium CG22_combo_CG10-13_8_21_14_all_47_15]|uniref:Guanylate kinase-like domain-containing protein n=1 Tax=Candidatus Lloydbacteria bacterium CG22_combo_CG10-13_8_21_14_all_47_15 TaxID=1974635 RepID=A0A2H0CUP8_9BACT|nr:MAG: hypothetical protein COW88_01955 [Candidatus Lloydbacteria bacterium CG22_combo_CG10-13_8_21_14_all_47_15]
MATSHIPDVIPFIAICGPAGAGKSKLSQCIFEEIRDPRFTKIPSITTRPPRDADEKRSWYSDYIFVSEDEFIELEASNQFAWTTEVGDYRYGTPKKYLHTIISSSRHTGILIITPDTVPILKSSIGAEHFVLPIFVNASRQIIMHRLMVQDHLTEREADARLARCASYENDTRKTGLHFAQIYNNNTVEEMVFQFYRILNSFFHEHAP